MYRIPVLLLSYFLSTACCFGQEDTIILSGRKFIVKQISEPSGDGDSIIKLSLFRAGALHGKPVLDHTLYESGADCNSVSVELGTYRVTDNSLVFYSYWAKAGDAPASPYGVRKQVYRIGPDGRLTQVASLLTVKEPQKSWKYIERYYHGRLLQGKSAEMLEREVRQLLAGEIRLNTSGWETIEAFRTFGIYR